MTPTPAEALFVPHNHGACTRGSLHAASSCYVSLCWHQVLEQLCKDVQAQAVLYQESIRNASELEDTTGVELYPAAAGGKARPMVVIKQVRPWTITSSKA